ncbi:LPS assembly lipoprotein LptE [Pyruvatibacter sp.]|uniref:LPS assembly lipoprotein LptE n=1 Tax=Pyruvatibacter sp. TaxID=1981328 RepID=UPI0032EE1CA3
MHRSGGFVFALAASLLLAACSFRPLYGSDQQGTAAREGSADIMISAIGDNRVGQQLRNGLIDRLTPRGQSASAAYRLDVAITDVLADLLVQEDSTVLRRNYRLTATYRLIEVATGEQVFSAQTTRTAALNRLDSEYANVIAQRDAEERAADAVASVIAQRLGIALSQLASPENRRKAALREAAIVQQAPAPRATPPQPAEFPLSAPRSDPAPAPDPIAAPVAAPVVEPVSATRQTSDQRFPDPVAIEPGQ